MQIESINQILDKYDVFLIDIWGVLHNGNNLFLKAKSALLALRKKNKKIILITNSPNRCSLVAQKLLQKSITSDLYDNIVSSGEVFYKFITQSKKYKSYFWLSSLLDINFLENTNITQCNNPKDADCIILQGWSDLEKAKKILSENLDKPIFCINPDIFVNSRLNIIYCAGYLAKYIEDIGGVVHYFGKPYKEIYELCLLQNNIQTTKDKIIAVGDNLNTDIIGATKFGIDSILVGTGVTDIKKIDKQYYPTYIMHQFA